MTTWMSDAAQLIFRWVHVLAAIAWIGHAFFFHSMENGLRAPEVEGVDPDVKGELWMVHGGGFFRLQKTRVLPPIYTGHLHWFKYEALLTWVSGFLLLIALYYLTGGIYMIDRAIMDLSPGQAVGVGLGTLLGGWLLYDFFWAGPIGKASPTTATVLTVLMIAGIGVGLTFVLSGRAAFLHTGALLGTLMTGNVWIRIIPGSNKMVAALKRGEEPDLNLGVIGHQRSMHNGYMHFPIVFLMISNHYPFTTTGGRAWLVMLLMLGLGAAVRQLFYDGASAHVLVKSYVVAATIALVALTIPRTSSASAEAPSFAEVQQIITTRCTPCHAAHPSHPAFNAPPKNLILTDSATILANKDAIHTQAVVTKVMPLGNLTQITDEERAQLGAWYAAGAPSE